MAAAGCAMLGRQEDAHTAFAVFEKARTDAGKEPFTLAELDGWGFKYTEDLERLRTGLRKAGVPEN